MSKRILPILVFFALSFAATYAQTIATVNNTPGTAATYRTLQGAVDSVATGSIILLQPAANSYGQVTINKLVSIFGAGYMLNQNPAPNTQANPAESIVDLVTFTNGSNGSMISGLSFNNRSTPYPYQRIDIANTSDITITRCYITRDGGSAFITSTNASNIVARQCIFYHTTAPQTILIAKTSNNFQFYNCIFDGVGHNWGMSADIPTTAVLFRNCTFKQYLGGVLPNGITNITYINNVIFSTVGAGTTIPSAAAANNVGNVSFSSGNASNITNAKEEDVLVLNTDPNIISMDGKLSLKAGSVAINYGNDGKNAGAFGGAEPYVLSGIPIIPNIYAAETLGTATGSGGLKIRIKAKANQ
jgi:hypothetical protein